MIKRLTFTAIVTILLIAAIFGISYFIGWLEVGADTLTPESTISLAQLRVGVGLAMLAIFSGVVHVTDIIKSVWDMTSD